MSFPHTFQYFNKYAKEKKIMYAYMNAKKHQHMHAYANNIHIQEFT